jgi:hypothetical protein
MAGNETVHTLCSKLVAQACCADFLHLLRLVGGSHEGASVTVSALGSRQPRAGIQF